MSAVIDADQTLIENIALAQAGDKDAWSALYCEYRSTVFAICMRRLRNERVAEDVTQDVFVRALRKLHQLHEPGRFPGWLKRIAIRLSINYAVRHGRLSQLSEIDVGSISDSKGLSPSNAAIALEDRSACIEALAELRPIHAEVLRLFYLEGLSLKQISTFLCRPIGTVKRRLHDARNRLRVQMESRGSL